MMLQTILSVFIVAVIGTAFSVQAQTLCPGSVACGKFGCYNPSPASGENCVNSQIVCNFGFKRCGNKCIRTYEECNACGSFERMCGNMCYKPFIGEECTTALLVCKSGLKACGKFCYAPRKSESCNQPGNIICKYGEKLCGQVCYNAKQGESCTINGVICNHGKAPCGNACYNVFAGETCNSGIICRNGERACGSRCYNVFGYRCINNQKLCRINEELCFGNSCYDPVKGEKCFVGGVVCKRNEVFVKGRCY